MKTIVDILKDTDQKTVDKVTKAFEKSGCTEYMSAFIAEATSATAMDFPKIHCMITNSFIGAYDTSIRMSYHMFVYPLDQVVNIYRSNISVDGKYDFTGFYLYADMADGSKKMLTFNSRKGNKVDTYDEIVGYFKNKKNVTGGEA